MKEYKPLSVAAKGDGVTVTVEGGDPVVIPAGAWAFCNGVRLPLANLPGWFEATLSPDSAKRMPLPVRLIVETDAAGTVTSARLDQ